MMPPSLPSGEPAVPAAPSAKSCWPESDATPPVCAAGGTTTLTALPKSLKLTAIVPTPTTCVANRVG